MQNSQISNSHKIQTKMNFGMRFSTAWSLGWDLYVYAFLNCWMVGKYLYETDENTLFGDLYTATRAAQRLSYLGGAAPAFAVAG